MGMRYAAPYYSYCRPVAVAAERFLFMLDDAHVPAYNPPAARKGDQPVTVGGIYSNAKSHTEMADGS